VYVVRSFVRHNTLMILKSIINHTSYFLTTVKYIILKSPAVFLHLKGHLKLIWILKSYKETELISLRTYAIYTSSYLSKKLIVKEKLKILTYHYDYLKKIFDPHLLNRLFKNELVFWSCNKHSETLSVSFTFSNMLEFEGSLALIFKVNEIKVFTLAFSFSPGNIFDFSDTTIIYIGCMQGVKDEFENYTKATKHLYENIPPVILVKVLEAFACALNIKKMLGITTVNQLSFGKDANFENFNNNYNKFWEAIGGKKFNDYYLIEFPLYQKPITLIPSKHRKRVLGKRKVLEDVYKDSYQNIKSFL